MPIRTEQVDKEYVRIANTYENGEGEKVYYGIKRAKTVKEDAATSPLHDRVYFLIEMPDGMSQIHPEHACTEITEKEYFLAVLGGNV